ncbi:MAG: DUF6573 family protein [Gammaproteobacteria bacterium]|nr:DUF6573 family protein [Gammaproteobacteria bacterium]MDZ7753268.1 DUF6573 family protein [Gammaproteobacteria bacterium]
MSDPTIKPMAHPIFGEVISTYTRAQALEDGVLVAAGIINLESGFAGPVALTAAAWADCVAWTPDDSQRQLEQREGERLWNVLYSTACAIRLADYAVHQLNYEVSRVARDGVSTRRTPASLKCVVGPGDDGEPVMTILLPNED